MSEYIKSDVSEYLTNRTMDFEKAPPDFVWENIEKHIPIYQPKGTTSTLVKLVIGTMSLSVIIFAILWFKSENFTPVSNEGALTVNKKVTTQIPLLTNTSENNENATIEISKIETSGKILNPQQHSVISKTENKQLTETGKNVTYSINASGLLNVTEISFVDENNKVVLSTKNPTPNSFGFYIIDISQLAQGTYSILLTTNEGTRLHKKESFK